MAYSSLTQSNKADTRRTVSSLRPLSTNMMEGAEMKRRHLKIKNISISKEASIRRRKVVHSQEGAGGKARAGAGGAGGWRKRSSGGSSRSSSSGGGGS
eukprot:748658-Hanusia_phi.AAC.1